MKIGDKVDVYEEGSQFEAEVVGINDENDTIAVRDARGVLYNYLPREVSGSIRFYTPKAREPKAKDRAPVPDLGTAD